MKIVRCNVHNVNYRLPTTESEFLLGRLHNDVISCNEHLEQSDCIFEEIIDE